MELGKIMEKHRHRLWLNIMEDLGPPEGCVIPTWLVCVYMLLFPLQGLRWIIDRHMGFDPLRMVWTIHGIDYSDRIFHRLAIADGVLYRFVTVNKVLTVEIIAQPPKE